LAANINCDWFYRRARAGHLALASDDKTKNLANHYRHKLVAGVGTYARYRELRQTALVWLSLTLAALCVEWTIAKLQGAEDLPIGLVVGIGVSLFTFLVGKLVIGLPTASREPVPRLVTATAVRMAIPFTVIAAIAATNRELLDKTFLAYFLPFQFITLIADTLGAVRRVRDEG